jgi:hypothetical protein
LAWVLLRGFECLLPPRSGSPMVRIMTAAARPEGLFYVLTESVLVPVVMPDPGLSEFKGVLISSLRKQVEVVVGAV